MVNVASVYPAMASVKQGSFLRAGVAHRKERENREGRLESV